MKLTDIQIARNVQLKKITEIANEIDITEDDLELYGKYKAKLSFDYLKSIENLKYQMKLIQNYKKSQMEN